MHGFKSLIAHLKKRINRNCRVYVIQRFEREQVGIRTILFQKNTAEIDMDAYPSSQQSKQKLIQINKC
ncbi:hypothetical protein DBY68_016350 [Pseudocitrobacter sp. RIT415]|nr:hypothetical protein DBY68_016350 [Pseudocitrobacter sp. RIT 415]